MKKNNSHGAALLLLFLLMTLSGCGLMKRNMTQGLADSLSLAISDNNDLETVKDGSPAYLLMVDAFVLEDPDNATMLRSASDLYTTYSGIFVTDKSRAKNLTEKALDYAFDACCKKSSSLCSLSSDTYEEFTEKISSCPKADIPELFTLGAAWAAWIQARSDSVEALAQISRIETIMQHIIKTDEKYKDGTAHLYMGVISILLPPALGGKPDIARAHFERAIGMDGGKNLMIKVVYAKKYARMMFDQQLHDSLLNEVINSNPRVRGYTLVNTLAQLQAKELLDSGNDYF